MRSSASSTPETPLVQKRKRALSNPTITPFNPRLKIDIVDTSSHEDDRLLGARSPRSAVADRLSNLRLNGPLSVTYFNGSVGFSHEADGQHPKKVRVTTDEDDEVLEEDGEDEDFDIAPNDRIVISTEVSSIKAPTPRPGRRRFRDLSPASTSNMEIQETPEPEQHLSNKMLQDTGSMESPTAPMTRTLKPVQPHSSLDGTMQPVRENKASAVFPPSWATSPVSKQKSPKRAAESTNHEATTNDDLDPDDDGTGINGIGFRPTPAEAWARAQRRKKQLSEWRARETKEARQRRSERRNRSEALLQRQDTAMEGTISERPRVRFAS